MFTKFARGMVYWANLPKYEQNPNVQQGMRPVIIVSNNVGNVMSKLVTVVPCTTNTQRNELPTHYQINLGREEDSCVLCEMILTVNKDLLSGFIGILDENTMVHIDKCIMSALGLVPVKEPEVKIIKQPETLEEKQKRNKGKRVSTKAEMIAYIDYYKSHTPEETMAEYGIPTKSAACQRVNYYKRKIK